MDAINKQILRIIQEDASLSISELAAQVGLSRTACGKRLQRFAASGVIRRQVALLDPENLGLGTTIFVFIEVGAHSSKELTGFVRDVAAMEEVMDIYRVAGNVDYIFRVVVADTAAFDGFYQRLTKQMRVEGMTSRFVLEQIKSETAFPIKD